MVVRAELPKSTDEALVEFQNGIGKTIFSAFSHHIVKENLRVGINGRGRTELLGPLLVNPEEHLRARIRFGTFLDENDVTVYYVYINQPDRHDRFPGVLEYNTGGKGFAVLRLVGEPNKPEFTRMLTGIANALPAPVDS